MSWLVELGIARRSNLSTSIFTEKLPEYSCVADMGPSELMRFIWDDWIKKSDFNNAIRGKLFELAIGSCLYGNNILPYYREAMLLHVHNVQFDFAMFCKGLDPIVISAKTSFRERWKQADLEGRMLKQVYPRAVSYLLTFNESEACNVQKKVSDKEAVGIDEVILANHKSFDSFIVGLKKHKLLDAITQDPVINPKVVLRNDANPI